MINTIPKFRDSLTYRLEEPEEHHKQIIEPSILTLTMFQHQIYIHRAFYHKLTHNINSHRIF